MDRYPLRRPQSGRLLLGVCQGIADHLAVNVWIVRAIMVGLGFLQFAGILIYVGLAIAVPTSTDIPDRVENRFSLSPRNRLLILAALSIVAALVLWLTRSVITIPVGTILAVLCVITGASLAWTNVGGSSVRMQLTRLISGMSLLVIGVIIFAVRNESAGTMFTTVLIGVGVLTLSVLAMWPATNRILKELDAARQERAAESARADIAAHLHDSVLQTLTLIRNSAADPATVTRLARVQERQLRSWLYTGTGDESSLPEALRHMVGEVEDLYGATVDYVSVGDSGTDMHSNALLAATREAVVNAVRHGAEPVSVYVEFSPAATDVFVRDHGQGFTLETVPEDRHGVRDSILARTERHGGTATIRPRDPGTEVHIHLPRGEA